MLVGIVTLLAGYYTMPGQHRRYMDWLRVGRSGDRIQVQGENFRTRSDRPGSHPASYKMGTVSFTGVKRPGRGVDHPPTSSAEVEGRVELYICCNSLRSGKSSILPALNLQPVATREPDGLCGNQRYRRELLMMGIMVPEIF